MASEKSNYYVKSENIDVFPCSNRPEHLDNRWLTEYNLVNMVNRLVDTKSFVVTNKLVVNENGFADATQEFIFNVGGYVFVTTIGSIISSLVPQLSTSSINSYVTASIVTTPTSEDTQKQITSSTTGGPFLESNYTDEEALDAILSVEDSNKYFTGVAFQLRTEAELEDWVNDDRHLCILQLTQYDANAGFDCIIPSTSKLKFETDTLGSNRSVKIDDGDFDLKLINTHDFNTEDDKNYPGTVTLPNNIDELLDSYATAINDLINATDEHTNKLDQHEQRIKSLEESGVTGEIELSNYVTKTELSNQLKNKVTSRGSTATSLFSVYGVVNKNDVLLNAYSDTKTEGSNVDEVEINNGSVAQYSHDGRLSGKTPTLPFHYATKKYVDSVLTGGESGSSCSCDLDNYVDKTTYQNKVDSIDGSISGHTNALGTLANNYNSLQQTLNTHETRIATLEASGGGSSGGSDCSCDLSGYVTAEHLSSRLSQYTTLSQHEGHVSVFEAHQSVFESAVRELQQTVSELEKNIGNLQDANNKYATKQELLDESSTRSESDLQHNNRLADLEKNLKRATYDSPGTVQISRTGGIKIIEDYKGQLTGELQLDVATTDDIQNISSDYGFKPITASNFRTAIKTMLGEDRTNITIANKYLDNGWNLDADQQQRACDWLGAVHKDIGTPVVTVVNGNNTESSGYKVRFVSQDSNQTGIENYITFVVAGSTT